MKTKIENNIGDTFEIVLWFSHEFKGRGGWNINCEVSFQSKKKTFSSYTTDSEFIDLITLMKADNSTADEIQTVYFEKAFHYMEESILEYCEEIIETIES